MGHICDVAIIGAGPYGLSLAAHLEERDVAFRIFGKPMQTWRQHVPKGMLLKSDGFASNLSSPVPSSRLADFCAANGRPYADKGTPIHVDDFNAYAAWFQKHFVPALDERNVASLVKCGDHFRLTLEDGEQVAAHRVVLATGITHYARMPGELDNLPEWATSHSYAHHDVARFAGKQVTVLGAGASAIDLAVTLKDAGADVRVVARRERIAFHDGPSDTDETWLTQLRRPSTGIGPGWRSFLCVHAPLLFQRLPEEMRLRAVKNHLGPAPGYFMRERFNRDVPSLLGHDLVRASTKSDRVALDIVDRATGTEATLTSDHVIAATGYKVDLARLPFLSRSLLANIDKVEATPILSDQFETSVSGLYATGINAANSFGPMLRFMYGAEFAAPKLAAHLERRIRVTVSRRAA